MKCFRIAGTFMLLGSSATFALPGLSPVWERLYNNNQPFSESNPLHAPTADPDGDGWNNLRESIAGTDPFSGLPGAGFIQATCTIHPYLEGKFIVEWPSQAGKNYQLEFSEDLVTWTPFGEAIRGEDEVLPIVIAPEVNGTGNPPEKSFWRVRVGDLPSLGGSFNPWDIHILTSNPLLTVPGWNMPSEGTPSGSAAPPNSDNAGGDDYTDAAPNDNLVNWERTPDARYLYLPVNQSGIAVDMNDQGKILFQYVGVTDYTTHEIGVVYDPFKPQGDRASKVMFNPGSFELRMWKANGPGDMPDPSDAVVAENAIWPPPPDAPERYVRASASLLKIGDDGSLIAGGSYSLSEFYGGATEAPSRLGFGELVFLWKKDAYQNCFPLGEGRGYQSTVESSSRNRVVGFYQKTDGADPGTRAVVVDHPSHTNGNPTAFTFQSFRPTAPQQVNETFGAETSMPPDDWAWGKITASGKILYSRKVSAQDFQYIVAGTSQRRTLPASVMVDHFTDMPAGGPQWGAGNDYQDFMMWNGALVSSTPLAGATGFDQQGVGIGNGKREFATPGGGAIRRHVWQNARWFDLQSATNLPDGNFGDLVPRKITRSGLIWLSNADGTSNGVLVPVRVKDNLPAKGVDDESIRVHPIIKGYQDRVWIMAPAGNDHNSNPNQNRAEFMLPLAGPATLGIATGTAMTDPPSFVVNPDPGLNSILWHGTGNSTTDYSPTFSLSGQSASGNPVGVKVMKHRKARVRVYKVAKYLSSSNSIEPDPAKIPSEEEMENHLNALFGPQINCYFDLSYNQDGMKVVDWGDDFNNTEDGSHSTDQTNIITEFGGLDEGYNMHVFIVGKNGPLGNASDAKGITSPGNATVWIAGRPSDKTDFLETLGHEIGHVFLGLGHPDHPDIQGVAPLYGTDLSKRLMCSGTIFNSNSKLLVKAEWDEAEKWMSEEEKIRSMNP